MRVLLTISNIIVSKDVYGISVTYVNETYSASAAHGTEGTTHNDPVVLKSESLCA